MEKSELVKTSLRLERNILEAFQDAVEDNYGKLKGGQNEALREAVLLWLAHKRGVEVILMNDDRTGKMEVFPGEDVDERLREALLSRKRPSVTLWRAGVERKFLRGTITKTLNVLLGLYGVPDESGIIDVESDELLEKLPVSVEGWEEALWRAEDGYEGDVAIKLVWREHRMSAMISPEVMSVHSTTLKSF
jgi:hypothetical protein